MFRRFYVWFLQCLGFDPRGIFSFHDGKRWRHVDPIVVARRLWSVEVPDSSIPTVKGPNVPFESDNSRALIRSGIGTQVARGYGEVAFAVRDAFQVPELTDGGLTEVECDELLEKFENYVGDLKKNGNGLPTSPTSSDSTGQSSTNSESDASTTSTEHLFVMPDVSGMELTSGETSPLDNV